VHEGFREAFGPVQRWRTIAVMVGDVRQLPSFPLIFCPGAVLPSSRQRIEKVSPPIHYMKEPVRFALDGYFHPMFEAFFASIIVSRALAPQLPPSPLPAWLTLIITPAIEPPWKDSDAGGTHDYEVKGRHHFASHHLNSFSSRRVRDHQQ